VTTLTERQQAVLAYIETFRAHHGYPPTVREIGDGMGIRSTNGVNDHLRALERKGWLRKEPSKSRGLQVVGQDARVIDGVRRVGAALGVELGDPLPEDWLRRLLSRIEEVRQ